jgi:hypothetical protein
MGRLIEKIRFLSIQLRDNRSFSLMVDEGVQQELRATTDIMDMSEFREGDVRLSLHRDGMSKRCIGHPIHRRHPYNRLGE